MGFVLAVLTLPVSLAWGKQASAHPKPTPGGHSCGKSTEAIFGKLSIEEEVIIG
jgi:hypothetical protein